MWRNTLFCLALAYCLLWLSGDVNAADQRTIVRNSSSQGKRVALVIGNSAYRNYPPLSNTGNDARSMVTALQAIGFEVLDGKALVDLDRQGLENAIQRFGRSIRGKQVGLFYYAGHGVQVDGKNYLIPVLANVESNTDIKYQLVDVNFVLDEMNDAETPVNVIILDACRNNPFAGKKLRGIQSGLASINAPKGTFIAYSTAPGKTASDGQGFNSPYTAALSRIMTEPGQRIEDVFIRVGVEVEKTTGGAQEPWQNGSLRGIFYLSDMPAETGAESSGNGVDKETVFWQSIMGSTNPAQFEAYLRKYPKGEYASLAKLKIEELKKSQNNATKPGSGSSSSVSSDSQTGIWTDPVTGMVFVWVPEGCYQMGCGSWTSNCYDNESPVHEVCVDGFWMGQTEVTQGQWQRVMGSNPSSFQKGDNYPVEKVSWDDTKEYIRKLNSKGSAKFRLPSEAEWEYAARSGGKAEKYSGGGDLDSLGWHDGNSGKSTHPVKTKKSNGLGIYDMTGNVWEWCEDVYIADIYGKSDKKNPIYNSGGPDRVFRGGSWYNVPGLVRCAYRNYYDPSNRSNNVGFRLLRMP